MIGQLNMNGLDKVQTAIERLRRFEPEEGYYLAFSGGKDSVTVKALCDMAGVKYNAQYSVTSIDPPELVQFVKTFGDVDMYIPRYKDGGAVTMWNLIPKKGMPPTRIARYCCQYFKEQNGQGRFKVTGVRWEESANRKAKRAGLEIGTTKTGTRTRYDPDEPESLKALPGAKERILNPIIDWSSDEVWEFIRKYNIRYCTLYDKGAKRLGCVGCPLSTAAAAELERWPKFKAAYLRAFQRMLDNLEAKGIETTWKTPEEVMKWWLQQ